MGRIFVTGDKHADFQSPDDYQKVKKFCETFHTTKEDFMIVLGDHGVRYYEGWRDEHAKKKLAKYPIRFVMLRGNHDRRVEPSWKHVFIDEKHIKGWFIEDRDYPDILYTAEYGWYEFGGKRVFVINGAYSVDKWYRLGMNDQGFLNYIWFPDEQLTEKERGEAQSLFLSEADHGNFCIMSHTCPITYKPYDKLLSGINQNEVDETMEKWLDELLHAVQENKLPLETWYCGHWHSDHTDEVMRFMYHDIIEFGE